MQNTRFSSPASNQEAEFLHCRALRFNVRHPKWLSHAS
jgi:hypothetical protein